jgi:hypothetical protein
MIVGRNFLNDCFFCLIRDQRHFARGREEIFDFVFYLSLALFGWKATVN